MLTFENLLKEEKNIESLKDENLETLKRLLKNAQSKKCRSKAMNRQKEYEKTCQIIESINKEIDKYKVVKNVNINEMSLVEINKAIKNAQSKKCLAKAMNRQDKYNEALNDEIKFVEMKDKFGKQPKVNKIQVKIDELKKCKQTNEIKNQIKLLESLL